jgi:hypothetical protein
MSVADRVRQVAPGGARTAPRACYLPIAEHGLIGDGWSSKQLYLPDTNILITRFLTPGGVGEVQDFMPPPRSGKAAHRHRMIRRVLAVNLDRQLG